MATISEDYVSLETAKLLREKGFPQDPNICNTAYTTKGRLSNNARSFAHNYELIIPRTYSLAPTLQMAMKWLREVHKIHIQIWILEEKGYWFDIEKILNAQYKHKYLYSTGLEDIYFKTYEQACETAIKYCLENLI